MPATRAILALGLPLAALWATLLALQRVGELPASFAGLRAYAPHIALVLGLAASSAFRRGRIFFSLVNLALAWASLRYALQNPASVRMQALMQLAALIVPLNLGVLAWLPERGILSARGVRYACGLLLEAALVAAGCTLYAAPLTAWLYRSYIQLPALAAPLTQPVAAVLAMALLSALAAWFVRREAAALGIATAIAALGLALHGARNPDAVPLFVAAAALVLTLAVLQDTFRMAFRDELTGLNSRRALDESMAGLGRHYAIAMVDVDHFKRINDSHGHETGDQVLRMIASRVARVGGGGKAYRYGGEEFVVLFTGRTEDEVLPYLEAIRKDIAGYAFALRGHDRGGDRTARTRRGTGTAARRLKITVSIGLAEPGPRQTTPEAVVLAADRALYRAKRGGRNKVSL